MSSKQKVTTNEGVVLTSSSSSTSSTSADMCDLLQQVQSSSRIPFSALPDARFRDADEHRLACSVLLKRMSAETMCDASRQQVDDLMHVMVQPFPESVLFLSARLISEPENMVRKFLLSVVKQYVAGETLVDIMSECCVVPVDEDRNRRLIQSLLSLPDRVTDFPLPATKYYEQLADKLLRTLVRVAERVSCDVDSDLSLVADMITRMSVRGCCAALWIGLMQPLCRRYADDMVMRRISFHVLVHKQPDRSTEHVLRTMCCEAESGNQMLALVADAVMRKERIRYLLTEKFVVVTCFPSPRFGRNLMQYLHLVDVRSFVSAVCSAVSCWSSPSSLSHRSLHHNLFVYSLLVAAVRFFPSLRSETRERLHVQLVAGMETHVNNRTTTDLRHSGLFVGQLLMNKLNTALPGLDLDVEEDAHVLFLKSFLNDSCEESVADVPFAGRQPLIQVVGEEEKNDREKVEDDDRQEEDTKKPLYLLDCMQSLRESDDSEWQEQCLVHMPDLIRKDRKTACDVSQDAAHTLLHFPSDSPHRMTALIAVTSADPRRVSRLLIHEFYDRNTALVLRLDVLTVLAQVSVQLSTGSLSDQQQDPLTTHVRVMDETIDQCIAGHTTRRLSARSKQSVAKANAFAPFAADFFFPLIGGWDGRDVVLVANQLDGVLLSRLLVTLSVLLTSASQQLLSRRMASALLSFALSFRQHVDALVRRAVTFSFATVLTAAPAHSLLSDQRQPLLTLRDWLVRCHETDMDEQVRRSALRALFLLNHVVQQSEQRPAS